MQSIDELLPPIGRELDDTKSHTADLYARGAGIAGRSSVAICGLARSLGERVHDTMDRIDALGQEFGNYGVVIFENDSTDDTPKHLKEWAAYNPHVDVISEKMARKHWPATRDLGRMADLAEYRNRCRTEVLRKHGSFDYVIVLDTDLANWSVPGIINTLAQPDWDMMGSVSWAKMPKGNWVHYDVWAFRNPDYTPLSARQVNPWLPRMGTAVVPVKSCFGGLGVYRMEAYKSACYAGTDCEHVCLHRAMTEAGYGRIFINPSMVTIY